jgi:hypothetical protein
MPPELRWFWSVTAIVPATPGVTNGTAATLEEAKAKFRAHVLCVAAHEFSTAEK